MRNRFLLLMLPFLLAVAPAHAQIQCPAADQVVAPVDTAAFTLVQHYAARSPRHDGRYHTGEDWVLSVGRTEGQPVRAIANGVVTYSFDQGWGRDGGVVILEHSFPDGSIAYSMYGHITPTEQFPFPPGSACVEAGQVIGAIGDARPAPHLHFEVRSLNGRTPGPGYTWAYPDAEGYRRPSAFVAAWQARLRPSIAWVTLLSDERGTAATPVRLDDNSLLLLDAGRIVRVLPDGRVFWRTRTENPPVALSAGAGRTLVHDATGRVQQVNPDGTLGEFWQTNTPIAGPPFPLDGLLVFPKVGGGWAALSADRRDIAWETAASPPFIAVQPTPQTLGVVTPDRRVLTLSRGSREVLDEAFMRGVPSLATANDGTLLVYSVGGMWRVLADGVWEPVPNIPVPEGTWAVGSGIEGDLLVYDGGRVRVYGRGGVEAWSAPLAGVTGAARIAWVDGRVLLLSDAGAIATASPLGQVCRIAIHGTAGGALWYDLGEDGILRVRIGGTLVGIDWGRWKESCPS